MKKFTKGLLIFSLLLFIGGAGCLIAGCVMGITTGDLKQVLQDIPFLDFENQKIYIEDEIMSYSDIFGGEEESGGRSFPAGDVVSMELELSNVNCKILYADVEQITVVPLDNSSVTTKLINGVLKIEKITNIFGDDDGRMEIYLPKDLYLSEFDLQSGAGNIVIDASIHAKEISIEAGASAVSVNGTVTAESLSVELGAGMASFNLVDAKEIKIENGAGQTDMGLAGQKEQYNVTIESAAGNVHYGDEAFAGVAEEYRNQPKDADKSIQIESALGEVNITFKEEI